MSPLLRSGASIAETVGCVQMPGTPRRTVVGGVFACAPWTQEFIRSVEQPKREERPFQQIGKTPPPKEKPLLKPSANVVLETYTCTNSELCPHELKKKRKRKQTNTHVCTVTWNGGLCNLAGTLCAAPWCQNPNTSFSLGTSSCLEFFR